MFTNGAIEAGPLGLAGWTWESIGKPRAELDVKHIVSPPA